MAAQSSMDAAAAPTRRRVKPPLQQRSRDAWNRILDAGVAILVERGRTALTIGSVCQRAKVAPSAIYARVDGISGLFWAIYDREIAHVLQTNRKLLSAAARTPPGSDARIRAVVHAMCETFRRYGAFLEQIVSISVVDPALRERGSQESLAFLGEVVRLLPSRPVRGATDVARMIHQECVFRALYGDRWLSRRAESNAAFERRVSVMALCRLGRGWRGDDACRRRRSFE